MKQSISFFEEVAVAVFFVGLLAITLSCSTVPTNVTTGSDNATVTATADLLPYLVLAATKSVEAEELYNSTRDATVLAKVNFWTQYALGVANEIEKIQSGEAVK